ncbi:MAG TPA: hypothetical protein VM734_04400 [Kofleriaceae bacterium]|nr:hypothetical protein [Kofleriaceae bacterium]
MLLLALVVFGVTAWFLGMRVGAIAAGVSFASLIAADIVPSTSLALAIYALHVVWLAGMVYLGPRISRMLTKPEDRTLGAQAKRWMQRGKALGEAFWKSRK